MPRAIGYASTSAITEVPLAGTTINEQASGAQRSIKSASANDAAAGTGVRTVRVWYYTLSAAGVITGPFSEVLTLNGTTAVPTIAANIALVDRIEALTVGGGGVAAGAISLFTANDGTGTAIAAIAAGDTRTFLAQVYVPSGRRCFINEVAVASGEATTVATNYRFKALQYGVAGAIEQVLPGAVAAGGLGGSRGVTAGALAVVAGPARVRLYVTPGAVGAAVTKGEFSYYLV